MKLNSTVRNNIALACPEAAQVLDAAAAIMSPNGSFTHFPNTLKVYDREYEIGLRFLIEHKVVCIFWPNWTAILAETGHGFWLKLDSFFNRPRGCSH